MGYRNFGKFFWSIVGLTVLMLVGFAALQALQVPAGHLIDWLVGIASFWWLAVIITIPWNIHFLAREALVDADGSRVAGITVAPEQLAYVRRWAGRSLVIAIVLHICSAIALYALAATGISAVGYVSAVAALLLTGLRPAVRAYSYVIERLAAIRKTFKYPREDVLKLTSDLSTLTDRVDALSQQADPERKDSLAAQQRALLEQTRTEIERLRLAVDELRASNQSEHARLSREAQSAIAQITADGQFLDHVREIIRFFKSA